MTAPETPTPPARDALDALDALTRLRWELAELLGWTDLRIDDAGDLVGYDPDSDIVRPVPAWPDRWSPAGALLERVAAMGYMVSIRAYPGVDLPYAVRVVTVPGSELSGERHGPTGPATIALAVRDALRARGGTR
jgi:hypothetical protein